MHHAQRSLVRLRQTHILNERVSKRKTILFFLVREQHFFTFINTAEFLQCHRLFPKKKSLITSSTNKKKFLHNTYRNPQLRKMLLSLILDGLSGNILQQATHNNVYRVQSKVVRTPFSLQPLALDLYFQLQNWFKKCKDSCYGIFKFQKSIFRKLQKLTFYTVLRSLQSYLVKVGTHHDKHNTKKNHFCTTKIDRNIQFQKLGCFRFFSEFIK